MKGWYYQLKNSCRDKMCLLAFFLPILAGFGISQLTESDFSALQKISFYVAEQTLSQDTLNWLSSYGTVTAFPDENAVRQAVNDPSTQGIGVLLEGESISTLLSGDEFTLYCVIGDTLPELYEKRSAFRDCSITVIPAKQGAESLITLLIAITIITAMFMGCTFNAMSMIGEKEDGISMINEVLPMTKGEFVLQKISLGLGGGILSSLITVLVCFKGPVSLFPALFLLILLSALTASLSGLLIGTFSKGLMSGIGLIKLVMIFYLAPPILCYLILKPDSALFSLSYLLPSAAAFYGLMDLLKGVPERTAFYAVILAAHTLFQIFLCLLAQNRSGKAIS